MPVAEEEDTLLPLGDSAHLRNEQMNDPQLAPIIQALAKGDSMPASIAPGR